METNAQLQGKVMWALYNLQSDGAVDRRALATLLMELIAALSPAPEQEPKRRGRPRLLRILQTSLDRPVKHHVGRPSRKECILDYLQMKWKHGSRLNREMFITHSRTGRRFERIWKMSWRRFVEDAEYAAKEGFKVTASANGKTPK